MINNAVLVSGVQQSDSAIHIHESKKKKKKRMLSLRSEAQIHKCHDKGGARAGVDKTQCCILPLVGRNAHQSQEVPRDCIEVSDLN